MVAERISTEQEPHTLVEKIAFLPWGEWSGWAVRQLLPPQNIQSMNCEELVLFMMWLSGASVPRLRSRELASSVGVKRLSFEHAPQGAIAFFENGGQGFHLAIYYGENRWKEPVFVHSTRNPSYFLGRNGVMVSPFPLMSQWYPGECRLLVFPQTTEARFHHIDRLIALHEKKYGSRYWE